MNSAGNREHGTGNSMQMQMLKKIALFGATAATLVLAGCRQDMHDEPKFFPQRGTSFYADGRSVRPQVENTVARNQLHEDTYFYTGLIDGQEGNEGNTMPFPVTMKVLERGQERYNVYCTPCHSRVGNGMGMIVDRGYALATNYHQPRLEVAPLGHFFYVMTNGYGAMPDYAAQIAPVDRWAIVAYIKALQLSQKATQADVPAGAHVEPLKSIAEREGLPASFADPWSVPATSTIDATPDRQPHVLPPVLPNSGFVPAVPVPPNFTPTSKSPAAAAAGSSAPKQ